LNEIIISQNTSSGLQLYDPGKGLLALAAAEAAQRHFARTKNLDGLSKAIEAKLKEQRDFVLWRVSMGEKSGSRPKGVAELRHLCPFPDGTGCPTGASFIAGGR